MATEQKITTCCPVCRKSYRVPASALGRRAACARCKSSFRVSEHNPHPTEDDILRWLNEGLEEYDLSADDSSSEEPPAGTADRLQQPATPVSRGGTSEAGDPALTASHPPRRQAG